MAVIIVLLIGFIYRISVSNQQLAANDLKYRYIKMKGEATSKRIAELEEIFELNRDNAKIRQMKKDVEEYEQTIQRKVQLEEQARLKEREAERLNKNASRLKTNKPPSSQGIAVERNPQGHASCSANLADILTSSIS